MNKARSPQKTLNDLRIPEASAPSEITGAVTPGETSVATPSETSAAVRERLDTMKKTARAHEQTEVVLTPAEINALIAANGKSRGMASVGIDGNVAQLLLSIPLERLDVPFRDAFGLGDRYLNATVTIAAPPGPNATLGRTTCRACGNSPAQTPVSDV